MAFSTRFWSRIESAIRLGLLCLALILPAHAAGIVLESAVGYSREGRLSVDARFRILLDAEHENALLAGVPLTFTTEFTLTRPRWYWAMRRVADWFEPTARFESRLSYHALTRQYRVTIGSVYRSFETLAEALAVIGTLRDWTVFERGGLSRHIDTKELGGELRMQLDTSRLPKPLQLSLMGEGDWRLESALRGVDFIE
jgi:hypothetical protein